MYKLAVFDMDGTILDTLEDLMDSMNYILRNFGCPERNLDEIRSFVGNGILKLVERSFPEGTSESDIKKAFEMFNPYYKEHCAVKTKPYDGICDVICELRKRGVLTAVVSNKPDYGVQSLCKEYFNGMFDFAVGEKEGIRKKPSPDSVNEVLSHLGIKKEDAVYIGDSEVDVKTAENAGLDCIGVEWGFRGREMLVSLGVKNLVSQSSELLDYFNFE